MGADRAAALLAAKDFGAALAAYERLLTHGEDAAIQEGVAVARRALDDLPGAVSGYERAYRLRIEAGHTVAAGLVACTLADIELNDLGRSAVAAGWLGRARHHLNSDPEHPGHIQLEALSANDVYGLGLPLPDGVLGVRRRGTGYRVGRAESLDDARGGGFRRCHQQAHRWRSAEHLLCRAANGRMTGA